MRPDFSVETNPSRCAIYTRKSNEHGLDQAFNSLDAQREACAAFIVSQRHEGWMLRPELYDDGGHSGGTMKRPALQRLLADVEAKLVDTVVVYKVDRLTRSLADFAKIVEILDRNGASFVSITQAFNTTNSMGRLTLNVLLSFAQFEREVTGERIRDKIAISKQRGIWMGGTVPFGYRAIGRKLVVVDSEAAIIRNAMARYLELGSIRLLHDELQKKDVRTRAVKSTGGRTRGGSHFRRGGLRHLLQNRLYIGELAHKGKWYSGLHEPIVDTALFNEVQMRMASLTPKRALKSSETEPNILNGLVYDELGRPMSETYTVKGGKRYRYYFTHPRTIAIGDEPASRFPAYELEEGVTNLVADFLSDPRATVGALKSITDAGDRKRCVDALQRTGVALKTSGRSAERRALLGKSVRRIALAKGRAVITVRLGNVDDHVLTATLLKVRRGNTVVFKVSSLDHAESQDVQLVSLIADARAAQRATMENPKRTLAELAQTQGVGLNRFKKLLEISYLAPNIVDDILAGQQPVGLTIKQLTSRFEIPISWEAQRASFMHSHSNLARR